MNKEYTMTYEEERREIRRLALLCLEERELTEEELREIIAHGREVASFFLGYARFPGDTALRLLRYRRRRTEFEKLETGELERMLQQIHRERATVIESYGDNDDDLDDSFFEAPPIDSDQHILYEILEERKKVAAI